MIVALATLLLVCALLVALVAYLVRHQNDERRDWTKERQLLITKIQHPEYVVATPDAPAVPDAELLHAEPDEIDRVGEIMNSGGDDA